MVGTPNNGVNGSPINGIVGTPNSARTRLVFSMLNSCQESSPGSAAVSVADSDYVGIEFSKEDVEVLLNEKARVKSKYNFKERCEAMSDYIRRLRQCIRWYQLLEGSYEIDQDHMRSMLESSEQRCGEIEVQLRNKEEELNSVIMELRKNYTEVEEKLAKEESEKLAAVDSLCKEREARQESEKFRESLSDELGRAQRDLQSASQQISVLTDTHKRAQEYNVSLQQYNCKLQADLDTANDNLKQAEKDKATIGENLSELRVQNNVLQEQLTFINASYDEVMKQKDELVNEVACLRKEMQQIRDDRDRKLLQVEELIAEAAEYRTSIAQSVTELESLTVKSNELEARCGSQIDQIKTLEDQLAAAEQKLEVFRTSTAQSVAELDSLTVKSNELEARCGSQIDQIKTLEGRLAAAEQKLEMSDLSAIETRSESEGQKELIKELQTHLADAEFKLIEGEKLRKKLHNTILELKGNIRVFCRVRPLLPEDNSNTEGKIISFPSSLEALGRGIDLVHNGQKHSFSFDQVFMPDASQEDVFVEISQLVQSALDGYKVCIFAYGQTGSGKTYTMMGRPGLQGQKGLIPRSLEQIFKTVQSLESQGWKYEMQVSMLEIYNETIRDLLSTNRSSLDALKTENGAAGKQYAIKHDANGNTYVSDLTIVDVRSSKEVTYLLNQAEHSRSVGKTQMNEYSSRSHFVFTLRMSGTNEYTDQHVQGVLNLIDLAGSERLSKSGSTGDRLRETQAINKSLSSLGDVIFSLAKRDDHVPFRNSKLTYLLQPCLGGDSKTLMFVNISPNSSSANESLCSLRFASRVNACEIGTPRRQINMRSPESRLSYV